MPLTEDAMMARSTLSTSLAALLLLGASVAAEAQTPALTDEHHPDEAPQATPAEPDTPAGLPGSGPGTMDPDATMMPMMMMMRMMEGMTAAQQNAEMARGMGMMSGAMMSGATMRPMMARMAEMMALADSPGPLGMPLVPQLEMTPQSVRALLESWLALLGNPRLEIGEVAESGNDSIVAEIVTVDGSLVDRLAFNRYPGLFHRID